MQHINNLLDTRNQQRSSQTTCTETTPDRLSRSMAAVREVFRVLQATKGHKFSSIFPNPDLLEDAVRIWALEIMDAGLTPKQLAFGLRKAATKDGFCPDLAEFISMCRPSPTDLGLPSLDAAYREACQNAHPASKKLWSHPAVYHAYTQVGSFELRTLEEAKSRPMFEDAYRKTVDALLNGEELPEIPKAIEDQTGKLLTPEEREADKARGRATLSGLLDALGDTESKGFSRNEQIRRMELEDQIAMLTRKEKSQ